MIMKEINTDYLERSHARLPFNDAKLIQLDHDDGARSTHRGPITTRSVIKSNLKGTAGLVLPAASLHNRRSIKGRSDVKRQPGGLRSGSIQDPLNVASTSPSDQLTRYEVRIDTSCEADLVSSRL
jgi:hypothetical protein